MTLHLRAKSIWPGLNANELDILLWACTGFPLSAEDEVLAALKDAYNRSGGDLLLALVQADQVRTQMLNSGGLLQSASSV